MPRNEIIYSTKSSGGRIICVGTTSTRTLESIMQKNGSLKEDKGWTDIFIYPGLSSKYDGIITNFHLPESTLLMLVSALAGRDNIMKAYKEAVKNVIDFQLR